METLIEKKQTAKPGLALCNGIDSHSWATKMEVEHLISGKPGPKMKAADSLDWLLKLHKFQAVMLAQLKKQL